MKVLHVITGLEDGGAEGVLYRLCKHDKTNCHHVVSLSDIGKYGPKLLKNDIPVTTLNMLPSRPSLFAFIHLVMVLRREKPDVVQTWMSHANFVGGIAARFAGIRSVVWNIRYTTLEQKVDNKVNNLIEKLLVQFSWWLPSLIVVCAQKAMEQHEKQGYNVKKMSLISNGYDLAKFKPGLDIGGELRLKLGCNKSIPLIGMVGRFDHLKDHLSLLDALSILRDRGQIFRCVLIGSGLVESNTELMEWIDRRRLNDFIHLLGPRNDIPRIMDALDLHVLSSIAEGFPNVVAEAMSCGTPCVVTDVGDAANIVENTGWVVPSQDPILLAEAIIFAIKDLGSPIWQARCFQARQRIEDNFSIEKMIKDYNKVWSKVLL